MRSNDASEQVRKAYIDTSRGQIHYRTLGAGPAMVLLHWGPGHGEQYSSVVPALAAAGCRAIAPDLPGFGMSLRRAGHWSIGDFADNLIECLAVWGLERYALVGGHLASLIAMETALRVPNRIRLLVLDGTPTWDRATREKIIASATHTQAPPDEAGDHLQGLWKHLLWETAMWRPNVAYSSELGQFAMGLLKAKMLADFDMRPGRALAEYDACAALSQLEVPTLALTADDDPLNNCHEQVLSLVSGSSGHSFSGDHPIHSQERALEYVDPILNAMKDHP
jgi:pimeloyl-ACP methyl ester carboxylesterase